MDRTSGEVVWGNGVAGALIGRRRQVERERLKEGLRVWLERKAREIRSRKRDSVGVGVLVWRFSKKMKLGDSIKSADGWPERPKKEKVSRLKGFWESVSGSPIAKTGA